MNWTYLNWNPNASKYFQVIPSDFPWDLRWDLEVLHMCMKLTPSPMVIKCEYVLCTSIGGYLSSFLLKFYLYLFAFSKEKKEDYFVEIRSFLQFQSRIKGPYRCI